MVPTVAAMGEVITRASVAQPEETGMYRAGKHHWILPLLTWHGAYPNRGKKAFAAFGLLIVFAVPWSPTAGSRIRNSRASTAHVTSTPCANRPTSSSSWGKLGPSAWSISNSPPATRSPRSVRRAQPGASHTIAWHMTRFLPPAKCPIRACPSGEAEQCAQYH